MSRKYVLTDDCITVDGRRLYRIECVRPFSHMVCGVRGGYVEHDGNLSHDGNAWVASDAMVMGNARVEEDALVCDNACVRDAARISGRAMVYDNAIVSGNAMVKDDAEVKDRARVSGNAHVYGRAWISGDARVDGDAMVYEDAQVSEKARICGLYAQVHGSAEVTGNAEVSDLAEVFGDALVYGTACINGEARVGGNAHIGGDALVSQDNDYLHIDNLYPKSVGNGECYSVTAFVTVNKAIGVVGAPMLTSFHLPPVTVEEYEAWVEDTYGATDYKEQYQTVASLIKAWSKLHSNEMPRLIIAIGNGGCNVADTLCEIVPNGRYRLVMLDTDREQLEKHKAECEKVVLTGIHADDEAAIAGLLACGACEVVVVVCLGGKTGSRLAPLAARKASEVAACVKCVATLPFAFEGERRKALAEASLSELRSCLGGKVEGICNDELFEEYGNDNICDTFQQIDREVVKAVLS